MTNFWDRLLQSQILGVLVGGLITFGTQYALEEVRANKLEQALAVSLSAEVSSLMESELVSTQYIRGLLAAFEKGERWNPEDRPPERNFIVYEANASRIGSLGAKLAERVIRFYGMANRLREQVRFLGSPAFNRLTDGSKKHWLSAHLDAQESWQSFGRDLAADLKAFGNE